VGESGLVSEHVFKQFAVAGMLIPGLTAPQPVESLKKLGIHGILGVKVDDWDYTYFSIYTDEVGHKGLSLYWNMRAKTLFQIARTGLQGPSGSLTAGMPFGVPPIIRFGSKELQERFLHDFFSG
jgi:acyl-CoA dehydrogenase